MPLRCGDAIACAEPMGCRGHTGCGDAVGCDDGMGCSGLMGCGDIGFRSPMRLQRGEALRRSHWAAAIPCAGPAEEFVEIALQMIGDGGRRPNAAGAERRLLGFTVRVGYTLRVPSPEMVKGAVGEARGGGRLREAVPPPRRAARPHHFAPG